MKILVLDGNENQAVAAVRSLSRAGHFVTVGADTSWSKAGWSRRCRRTFVYPSPQHDAAAFVQTIARQIGSHSGTLVLPMTEITTLPLSIQRDIIFAAGGQMVLPAHEIVLQTFDKNHTTQLAQSLGLCVPRSILLNDLEHAREIAATFSYPAVLKPRTSEEVSDEGDIRVTGAPIYARDADSFIAAYGQLSERCRDILAQEWIDGVGTGYFALMRDGELLAEFAHRRLRDVRPTGSGSSLRQSIAPDEKMREAALSLLRALKWHGVAMVEFRLRADGTPVFLEINGRFWNSLALAVHAGVDFPKLLAQLAQHDEISAPPTYRNGVRCRWLLGDFRHLLEVMRGAPATYPGRFPNRLRTLFDVAVPVRGDFYDNFERRDPLPEIGDWLDFALHRLPAQLHNRKARQSTAEAAQSTAETPL